MMSPVNHPKLSQKYVVQNRPQRSPNGTLFGIALGVPHEKENCCFASSALVYGKQVYGRFLNHHTPSHPQPRPALRENLPATSSWHGNPGLAKRQRSPTILHQRQVVIPNLHQGKLTLRLPKKRVHPRMGLREHDAGVALCRARLKQRLVRESDLSPEQPN